MMLRIALFHAEADAAWARLLKTRLEREGCSVQSVGAGPPPGADLWLVIWSAAGAVNQPLRFALDDPFAPGPFLLLAADDTPLPPATQRTAFSDLRLWQGQRLEDELGRLVREIGRVGRHGDPIAPSAPVGAQAPRVPEAHKPMAPVPDKSMAPARGGGLLDLLGGLVGVFKRREAPVVVGGGVPPAAPRAEPPEAVGAAPPEEPTAAAPLDPMLPPEPEPAATPVQIAASAPRRCQPGIPFVAALAAYTEAARETALRHLAELGESDDRRVSDIDASHWRVGAPVVVRLSAPGARVEPAEQRFEWNGRERVAAFTVTVEGGAAAAVLQFAVFVADVPVASLPLRVAVEAGTASAASAAAAPAAPAADKQQVQGRVARSAFASYSSKDAPLVTQRLSTLARWSPGLDIFQDCLDLTPGENFKPQLAEQIAARDVFLLFWSRQAAASAWVRWEYGTALERKGIDAILPMPLEDPAIAPPPPELSEQHLRDRFLLAGYALAKVQEERARGSGG